MIMSIATELTRIQTAKADIKSAIEAKGVTVPSSATIDTYDDYVAQISGGGGGGDTTTLQKLIDRSITSIEIPSGTTTIGNYAFSYCTSLTSIDIPSGVTTIGNNAFYGCKNLASIEMPSSVTTIGYNAFQYCTSLTSIDIPSSVTTIGNNAFQYCTSLTSIDIPSSVTTISSYAFYGCTNLASVIVNPTIPPTLYTNVFNNTPIASGTGIIYVPAASVDIYKAANNWNTYASQIQAIPS